MASFLCLSVFSGFLGLDRIEGGSSFRVVLSRSRCLSSASSEMDGRADDTLVVRISSVVDSYISTTTTIIIIIISYIPTTTTTISCLPMPACPGHTLLLLYLLNYIPAYIP
ncbi:hypothetical protein R3P38DRAFT_2958781 [Favolaschia claudopus]|uniref:Secreted protein n=1 Tax=Favolaschia claudopus TaxID=2862362 RepID=A0AAW0BDJ2_9AGAR